MKSQGSPKGKQARELVYASASLRFLSLLRFLMDNSVERWLKHGSCFKSRIATTWASTSTMTRRNAKVSKAQIYKYSLFRARSSNRFVNAAFPVRRACLLLYSEARCPGCPRGCYGKLRTAPRPLPCPKPSTRRSGIREVVWPIPFETGNLVGSCPGPYCDMYMEISM